jgi:hypothetical protein
MLNIARNIYSVWNTTGQKNSELPEAEVIPIGESANEKKKLESATKKFTVLMEHENIPLPGFTLFKTDRKNWGSLDQTWLIIDPRGYLVRVSNDNLEMILHVTGITEGLIQEKCVWAREDSQTKMILVPVSSPKYTEAIQNTELIEGKVSMKDVQIGDTVILQNKLKGKYMGVASLYGPISGYSSSKDYRAQSFMRRQIVQIAHGKYHYQTDLKILKVTKPADTPMTREESMAEMNKDIEDGISYFSNDVRTNQRYFSTHGMIKLTSTHAAPKVSITFEEVDEYGATQLFYDAMAISDIGMIAIQDNNGNNFLIDFPYSASQQAISIHGFAVIPIVGDLEDGVDKISTIGNRAYYGSKDIKLHRLDKFKKFYKIVKHVKSNTFV